MRVTIPPGVDGIPTSSIPQDPQAFVTWFTSVYLKRWAANGDARNAVPTSASVQITGSIGTAAGIGIGPNSITNGELVERSPLSVMGNATGIEANVQDIVAGADGDSLQRIAGALVWAPVTPTISVADSIAGTGTPSLPLQLVNDSASPGDSEYYGTSAAGALGYHPLPGGSAITTITQAGGASQSYSVPTNANTIQVICVGGGGGGGGGAKNSISVGGGGGGAGGGVSVCTFRAADLGSSVTVTFSNATTGGNGGAGSTGTPPAATAGTAGSSANFGGRLIAYGGNGGGQGASGSGGAGGGNNVGTGTWSQGSAGGNGSVGGTATTTPSPTLTSLISTSYSNTGGGGGGGLSNPAVASNGSLGGASLASGQVFITIAGAAGGTAGSGGATGPAGSGQQPAGGGGGGASSTTVTGGAGGPGGAFGGGGGGGGATSGGTLGGQGGQGGLAAVIIIAW